MNIWSQKAWKCRIPFWKVEDADRSYGNDAETALAYIGWTILLIWSSPTILWDEWLADDWAEKFSPNAAFIILLDIGNLEYVKTALNLQIIW